MTGPRIEVLVSKAFIQDDWEDNDTMKQCYKHSSYRYKGKKKWLQLKKKKSKITFSSHFTMPDLF